MPESNVVGHCNNCWKKDNYDVFMCPTKEKCIPARDYSPKGPEFNENPSSEMFEAMKEIETYVNDFKKVIEGEFKSVGVAIFNAGKMIGALQARVKVLEDK